MKRLILYCLNTKITTEPANQKVEDRVVIQYVLEVGSEDRRPSLRLDKDEPT